MRIKSMLLLVSAVFVALPVLGDDVKDDLVAIEKSQWQAWKDRDGEAHGDVVTDDAVYVYADGTILKGKEAIMADISGHECQSNSLNFADFNVRRLAPEIAILTYSVTQDVTCEGQRLPDRIYVESIFVRQGGKWRTTSSQETPIE